MKTDDQAFEMNQEAEESTAEEDSKRRLRAPPVENMADLRRLAKRLWAEAMNPVEGAAIPVERLKVAASLLPLLRTILLDERAHAEEEASAESDRVEPERHNPITPEFVRPNIPARFIVPKP